jgi:DNA primase
VTYSREDIDRVRERTDLAELAAEVTKVKRSGRTIMAVCPFHQEKTPSLSIDPARGLYHCFGCGKGGDVFMWVQETQGLDFVGALELLARRAGVILTEDPAAERRRGKREELISATAAAAEFFHERLKTGSDAAAARAYLRNRGYEADIVQQFQLGYSPDSWDELVRHLSARKVSEATMVTAGLASRSSAGRLIDRFRGRIMFPIHDLRGDPVGFGARQLEGEPPKYLNTAESPIYHKSSLLYGLDLAKSEIVRRGEAVVVEGYTDVIAFHQADLPIAVATCGTALGEEHLDLLRRFTERVVLAFDADEAGAGAALRGFEKAVPGDLDLRVAHLPEGRDPAEVVAMGERALLLKAIEESMPILQFRIERELQGYDLDEAEARGRAVRAVVPVIAAHPDPLVRHEYAVLVSRRSGVELRVIEEALAREVRPSGGRRNRAPAESLTGEQKAERELLMLLLANDPGLVGHDIDVELFTDPMHKEAYALVSGALGSLQPGASPDLGSLLGADDSPPAVLLRRLAMTDRPHATVDEVVIRLKLGAVERRIEQLRGEIDREGPGQGHSDKFAELIALERQRRELRSRE